MMKKLFLVTIVCLVMATFSGHAHNVNIPKNIDELMLTKMTDSVYVIHGIQGMPDKSNKTTLAAIDLGSNSFHMIVANMIDGNIVVVDRIRDSVRLAAGLDDNRNITPVARERALQCLRQFGQRIQGLPDDAVSAVGTNTSR